MSRKNGYEQNNNDMARRNIIIRMMTVLAMLVCFSAGLEAQTGLHVQKAFERFGHAKGCKMVEMHDATLKGYQLHVYKSLTYKKIGKEIEAYLKEDKQKAKKIREVVENGRITSGYYMMPPLEKGMNRYVLFSDPGKENGAIIYIEGRLEPDDIMKLCYSKRY